MSLLMLKNEFYDSKMGSVEKDLDEWISHLEGWEINGAKLLHRWNNYGFFIDIANNLPDMYDVVLIELENCL